MDRQLDDIVVKAATGDAAAFRALHDAYDAFVVAQIRRVLSGRDDAAASDVAQDVWRVVHRDLANYDAAIASFTRWLSVISVRRALNHQRRERVRDEAMRRYLSCGRAGIANAASNPAAALERSELIRAVRECAAQLQGRQKSIFAAVRLAAANVATVAARHGITPGRVRGALCEANQKVLDCLRGKGFV